MQKNITTGFAAINDVLVGGFALGSLCEIYGDEGVGKTSVAVSISKEHSVGFIDMDQSLPAQLVNHSNRMGVPNGHQWTSFYCAQRIEMRQGAVQYNPESGQSESMTVLVRTTKNAHGPNFRESEMSFQFNEEPVYV